MAFDHGSRLSLPDVCLKLDHAGCPSCMTYQTGWKERMKDPRPDVGTCPFVICEAAEGSFDGPNAIDYMWVDGTTRGWTDADEKVKQEARK
jgi:hypothetical protein